MNRHRYRELAERYGTPLYVHHGDTIEAQYRKLQSILPESFEIFYSVKCNPLLGICQLFRTLGSGIEVASLGEMVLAFQAGFEPGNMIFTSPGKSREELAEAIRRDLYSINVESLEEALLINELAGEMGIGPVRVSVRIHPDFLLSGAGLKMTGVPTQFGIDEAEAGRAIGIIGSLPHLSLIGIHVFTGSQVLDADLLLRNLGEVIALALRLSEEQDLPLQFLDLGGGFGVPYFPGETDLDLDRLRRGIRELWDQYGERLTGIRICVESGRFLTAEAGDFLTRVLYVKECKGSRYVVCDGGSNHHASSAFLGRYVRNNFPMFVLGKEEGEAGTEVNVVGCLCTPTDVIGQKVRLTDPRPGDIVVVERSGAYGLTHSPAMFLSHALPAEILCCGNEIHLLRERGKAEDFLRGQHSLFNRESLRDNYVHSV